MEYTIRQVSEITGLTASTLRFYEKEQLFPPVERNAAGVRVYREKDLEWIFLITCLKNTDMPIRDIKQFMALCAQGDATLQSRLQMVLAHKRRWKSASASFRDTWSISRKKRHIMSRPAGKGQRKA